MATSLNRAIPARENWYEMVSYICARHTLTGADTPAYTRVGTLPAGSIITGINTRVATAVTGGTPVLGVGTSISTVGTNGNITAVLAETAGGESVQASATLAYPLSADVEVYVGTTGAATAGDVYVWVSFIKPLA